MDDKTITLEAPVWYVQGQPSLLSRLFRWKTHHAAGTLRIENDVIIVQDSDGAESLHKGVADLDHVVRWTPNMAFYFKDGSHFSFSFDHVLAATNGPSSESIQNTKPFEAYFSERNLLKEVTFSEAAAGL